MKRGHEDELTQFDRSDGLVECNLTGCGRTTSSQPNVGVLVLPRCTAPAAFSRATINESSSNTWSANRGRSNVVRTPFVLTRSLVENGMPRSEPSVAGRCIRRFPAWQAARMAVRSVTRDEGVESSIEPVEYREDDLDGRDSFPPNRLYQVGCREPADVLACRRACRSDPFGPVCVRVVRG